MSIQLKRPEEIDLLSDDELLAYHDDLHSFWLAFFEKTKAMRADEITREDIFNTHAFVVEEMSTRNLDHPRIDSLDEPLEKLEEEEPVVPALYLVPPHGEMIAKRTKTLIVKSIKFEENIGIPIYVFSDKYCWAKIVLAEPFEISLARFKELANRHRITEEERRKWWPGKRTLWAYEFQFIEAYDPPIEVRFKPGPQVWVREWEWIGEAPKEIMKIADIAKYDPTKANDAQLRDDWRIALAWHSTWHRTDGKGIKFDHDQIIGLLKRILKELIKRGPDVIKFNPEGMKPLAREAWDEIVREVEVPKEMLKESLNVLDHEYLREGFPWRYVAGRTFELDDITKYIPKHKVFVDPFCGAAHILSKKDRSEIEIISDIDENWIWFLKYVQNLNPEKIERLKRLKWPEIKSLGDYEKLLQSDPQDEDHKFIKMKLLNYYSYNNWDQPNHNRIKELQLDHKSFIKKLEKAYDRLESVKIIVSDYKPIVKKYDSKDTFFFFDPPWGQKLEQEIGSIDYDEFYDILKGIRGKWLLIHSENDLPDKVKRIAKSMRTCRGITHTFSSQWSKKHGHVWRERRDILLMNYDVELVELQEVSAQENFDKTQNFVFVPNFVSLIGSQVYGKENPEDQDILIRAKYDPETSELRLPAQNLFLKIERMLGEQHWVFEPTGPNWDHVPLFDLVLCKKSSFHVERMNEEEFRRRYYISESIEKEKIKPMKRFIPMKARAGYGVGLFTDPEKAWDLWAKGIVDKSGYVITEVKYDGLRFTLHRLGKDVAILTEDMKRDRVKILPQIKDELLKLKADNFILDCEIVWWKENAPIPRHDMMAIIVGKEPLGEEDIRANIFDILYLDDKDLTDLSYEERLKYLDRLLPRDLKYLKKVERLISKNKTDFIKAHDKASEYPGSEGSMVKDPAAPYDITGKRTAAWIKIKLLMEIHAKIIGMYLKPGHWKHKGLKEPDEPIIGDRAYELFKRLQRDESTYIFRVAILRDGKLEPIMSDRKLAPSDKVLRWVVDGKKDPFTGKMVEVGRGLRGEWRGTEDPKVWEMARGFPAVDPSGYAYGNTYAIRFDPPAKMGDIITVNPAVLRKFKIDEVERFSWIFPSVREIALARRRPDTADDLERMIRIWERRQVRKITGKVIDLREIWKKWASGVDYEWSC